MTTITILSLGAGVQSTALALMAERGMVDKPVAAIFADTGDEPAAVYRHVEWLRGQLSFPIHIVREGNGLGADFLEALGGGKNRASQPPFFVREPDLSPDEIEAILAEPEPSAADFADFAGKMIYSQITLNTGEVLELSELFGVRSEQDVRHQIAWVNWDRRRRRALNRDRGGMLWRACTRDYKIVPIRRKSREIMREHGATHIRQQIGISTDERERENASGVKFVTHSHPLLDLGWSRQRCQQWLWDEFCLVVPKSACRYCPYRSNAGWRHMRDNEPEEFELACQFDEAIREAQGRKIRGAGIVGQLFVHRSFVPLREAIFETDPLQRDFGFEQECEGMCGH